MGSSHSESVEPALASSGIIGPVILSRDNNPMSQSNSHSGPQQPKGTARTHRQRSNTSKKSKESESDDVPKPACRSRSTGACIGHREWREVPYSDRVLSSYTACAWPECFPNGPPDAAEIETVVRSCSHPTSYHRVSHANEDSQELECESGTDESQIPVASRLDGDDTCESLGALSELQVGNGVIWNGQSTPMYVVETASEPSEAVRLRGPEGGNYTIEWRPDQVRSYAIYPGVGVAKDVRRVKGGHNLSETNR